MPTALEVEDKYEVPPDFAMPSFEGVPGVASVTPPRTDDLDATYYDTSDLRLARNKITLRRRTGGADAGWHLKLPADAARQEVQRPLGRGRLVPKEFSQLVCARTRGAALVPAAQLRTRRTTRELLDGDGKVLASVADDEVEARRMDAAEGVALERWREIEIELVTGDRELLRVAGERLAGAGAYPSARLSKLATALGDRLAAAVPDPAVVEGPMTVRTPARDVIRGYLAEQLERMLNSDVRVRLDEPESIHDMRVASRRIRSTLGSFRRLLDGARARDLEVRLRALAGELGVVRDAEVLLERLLRELSRQPDELVLGPVRNRLVETLYGEVLSGRTALLRTMTSHDYAALIDELLDFVVTGVSAGRPGSRPAEKVLPKLVARRYRKMAERAARASAAPTSAQRAAALHDTRKAAKQVRYAAEAVSRAFGADAVAFAKQAENVQEVLGEHQDSVVAAGRLREMAIAANAAEGESAFTFGLLAGIEQARGQAARDAFDDVWDEVSRRRYRSWLQ